MGCGLKSIAIVFIGTGPYIGFFEGFRKRINRFFCREVDKKIYAFTDQPNHPSLNYENVVVKEIKHVGWPFITLHRFKFMNSISEELSNHSHVFFIDADLYPVDDISFEEFFEEGEDYNFIAVQHPGFINKQGTFEDNKNSTAFSYKEEYDLSVYRQGCFWGGKSEHVLKMIKECSEKVDIDTANGIMAKWHDESHMNRFFLENIDEVKTMGAGYAVPEAKGYEGIWNFYEVKMVHLDKDPKTFPRFEGDGDK